MTTISTVWYALFHLMLLTWIICHNVAYKKKNNTIKLMHALLDFYQLKLYKIFLKQCWELDSNDFDLKCKN